MLAVLEACKQLTQESEKLLGYWSPPGPTSVHLWTSILGSKLLGLTSFTKVSCTRSPTRARSVGPGSGSESIAWGGWAVTGGHFSRVAGSARKLRTQTPSSPPAQVIWPPLDWGRP